MFKRLATAGMVFAALVCGVHPVSAKVETVAWRGGYRYRQSSSAAPSKTTVGRPAYGYGYRGSSGRSSPLDYPPGTQPYASSIHQWNKYPNQPFYLRGERRSLGILP